MQDVQVRRVAVLIASRAFRVEATCVWYETEENP